jgi:hypothetical protein
LLIEDKASGTQLIQELIGTSIVLTAAGLAQVEARLAGLYVGAF